MLEWVLFLGSAGLLLAWHWLVMLRLVVQRRRLMLLLAEQRLRTLADQDGRVLIEGLKAGIGEGTVTVTGKTWGGHYEVVVGPGGVRRERWLEEA